jgi:hypothetical protein
LSEPAEGTPTISQGLVGPLDFLARRLEDKTLRGPNLEIELEDSIPKTAAHAFTESGQHNATLWLLRLIEVAVAEIENLPAKRIARMAAARSDNQGPTESTTYTADLRERLEITRRYEPRLAERLDQHVQRITELLE